tara:strand:- start:373 stop:5349 length:4977 start_codon:yes stop_codon:yes gene_type:complete
MQAINPTTRNILNVDPDPLTNPVRGIVTAEKAAEKRKTRFDDLDFIQTQDYKEGLTDYRKSELFKDLFKDQNFRKAMLDAKYIEHNISLKDYYKYNSDSGLPLDEDDLLKFAQENRLVDTFLTTDNQTVMVRPQDITNNNLALTYMPTDLTTPLERGANATEQEDAIINKRLSYMFNNPIPVKGGNVYGFSVVDKKGRRYVIPGFEDTRKLLLEPDKGKEITPAVTYEGGLDYSIRTPKDETRRYFQLLKNIGMPEPMIAEFMYAQSNGMMDQYRMKHAASDFVKVFPFIFRGIGEFTTDMFIDLNNKFKDLAGGEGAEYFGGALTVQPKVDSSVHVFDKTRFGASYLSEKTNGLLSMDDAAALMSYSPSWGESIRREGAIGALSYLITAGGGTAIGMIKNVNFRRHVKNMFQDGKEPITFDEALEKANTTKNKYKRKFSFNELFEDYYNTNHNSFLRNFRTGFTLYTMKMAQDAKGIVAPKMTPRYGILSKKFEIENARLQEMINKNRGVSVIEKQRKLVNKLERNRDFEIARSFVPETFRTLLLEESGVTLGIASLSHLYQMNSVDPENMTPSFFPLILSAFAGSYVAEKSANGVKNLGEYVTDLGKAIMRSDDLKGLSFTDYRKAKGRAKDVFAWIGRADLETQEKILASLDSHKTTIDLISNIEVDGVKLISNPDDIQKSLYQLVGLNQLSVVGDQIQDIITHGQIRNLSPEFKQLLENQRKQTRLYNDLAKGFTALRKARLHPDVEANTAARNLLDFYLKSFDFLSKKLGKFDEKLNSTILKLEDDLSQFINGMAIVDTKNVKKMERLRYDYNTTIRVLSELELEKAIRAGYKPLEAIELVNKKLSTFNNQLNLNLKRVDSVLTTNEEASNAAWGSFTSIKSGFESRTDALFIGLTQKYGKDSSTPVYADMTSFYPILSKYDTPEYEEFFEPGEQLLRDVGKPGAKGLAKVGIGMPKNRFLPLFQDAADTFLKPENVAKYSTELQDAIKAVKDDDAFKGASNFEIWKELYNKGVDVKLPIDFEDWKMVAQSFSSKAYGFIGKGVQGKITKDLYEQWVELAEDANDGFSTNFFDENAKAPMGGEVVNEWKLAKGSHHTFAARYKHKLGKKWGAIEGTTETGSLITKESPMNWMDGIVKELASKDLSQERLDEIVSELAQATGGVNVAGKGQTSKYSFSTSLPDGFEKDLNDKGMILVQKLFNKAGKNYLLSTPTAKILLDELYKRNILSPNVMKDLKGDPNYDIFLKNLERLKTSDGKSLVNIEEVKDGIDARKFFEFSQKYKDKAFKLKEDIATRTNVFVEEFKAAKKQITGKITATKSFLENNLTGASIFKLISEEGDLGLKKIDDFRNNYSQALLAELNIQNISTLLPSNPARKEYFDKMQKWDKGIAGLYLEYLDKASKQKNPDGVAKLSKDQVTDEVDFEVDEMVDGQSFLTILGKNTPYENTVKEILRRAEGGNANQSKLYDDLLVIGSYMDGEIVSKGIKNTFKIAGAPRSLSLASWMSRAYAFQRGVVGPQWIGGEALIHTIKKKNYSIFKEMMENPDIGKIVLSMLESGEPPKGADSVMWVRALTNLIARERAFGMFDEDGEENALTKFGEDFAKSHRKNIDEQMKKIYEKSPSGKTMQSIKDFSRDAYQGAKEFFTGDNNENVQ